MSLREITISNLKWSFIESVSLKLISFILTIILARLLAPVDFGIVAVINVFYLLTVSLMEGGLKEALIQKQDATDKDYSSVFWVNLLLSLGLYLILFFLAPVIQSFYEYKELAFYIRLQGLGLIIDSLALIQIIKSVKELNLKKITQSRVPASLVSFAVGVLMAYLGYGVVSLIFQQILNSLLFICLLWIRVGYVPSIYISWESLKPLYSFGIKIFAAGYLNRIYMQSMNLIYAKFFSPSLLGLYTKSLSIQQLPANLVVNSVVAGTYPTMVKIQNDTTALKRIYKKNITILFILVCAISGLMVYQAENIVWVLLGEDWLGMIPFMQIVAAGGAFFPMISLNRNILKVRKHPGLFLKLEIVRKVVTIIAIVFTIQTSFLLVIAAVTVINVLMTFVDMYFSGKTINYGLKEQLWDILPYLIILSLTGGIINSIVEHYVDTQIFKLVTFTFLYTAISAGFIFFTSPKFIKSLYYK